MSTAAGRSSSQFDLRETSQVDAGAGTDLDEHRHDALAALAAHGGSRTAPAHALLTELMPHAAGAARACGRRHFRAEDGVQLPGDRVAVEHGHHVGPNRWVLTRLGSCPSSTSAAATASTSPV